MLKVARLQDRIPAVAELHRYLGSIYIYIDGDDTWRSGGTAHLPSLTPLSVAGCGISPLGYFSRLLQIVDN